MCPQKLHGASAPSDFLQKYTAGDRPKTQPLQGSSSSLMLAHASADLVRKPTNKPAADTVPPCGTARRCTGGPSRGLETSGNGLSDQGDTLVNNTKAEEHHLGPSRDGWKTVELI